jgi:hypothetical protein
VRATRGLRQLLRPLATQTSTEMAGEGSCPFRHPSQKQTLVHTKVVNGHGSEEGCLERYVFVTDRGGSYRFRFMFGRPLVEVVSGWSTLGAAAEIATAAFAASA